MNTDLFDRPSLPRAFGRWVLLDVLGDGGSARVFRAEPEAGGAAMAVKILRPVDGPSGRRRARSAQVEAHVGPLLRHPNLVASYGSGEAEGLIYLVMEFAPGVGLSTALRAHRYLPAPLAVDIAAQLAAGLDHAHNLGHRGIDAELVHRDLKPSNVRLGDDGHAKVMDFGLARVAELFSSTTETGLVRGTPAYMSPEQLDAGRLDARSDLFALGAILAEMVTGERVFWAATLSEQIRLTLAADERVQQLGLVRRLDRAAPGLGSVVRRALRTDPRERYASALEFETALRALGRSLPAPTSLRCYVQQLQALSGAPPTEPVPVSHTVELRSARPRTASPPGARDVPGHRDSSALGTVEPPKTTRLTAPRSSRQAQTMNALPTRQAQTMNALPSASGPKPTRRAQAAVPAPSTTRRAQTAVPASSPAATRRAATVDEELPRDPES